MLSGFFVSAVIPYRGGGLLERMLQERMEDRGLNGEEEVVLRRQLEIPIPKHLEEVVLPNDSGALQVLYRSAVEKIR